MWEREFCKNRVMLGFPPRHQSGIIYRSSTFGTASGILLSNQDIINLSTTVTVLVSEAWPAVKGIDRLRRVSFQNM